ncbi:hypothetical protein Ocin01_18240 [Orchesella cincta]|uniref:Uncharacterized protein n=1 Tax=Orchesella cincta TaxID=48709 RepID=A0A1D2M635_ORCCI|nr:hypothetical protein Ocin01_18240 [Orchesella cincta]
MSERVTSLRVGMLGIRHITRSGFLRTRLTDRVLRAYCARYKWRVELPLPVFFPDPCCALRQSQSTLAVDTGSSTWFSPWSSHDIPHYLRSSLAKKSCRVITYTLFFELHERDTIAVQISFRVSKQFLMKYATIRRRLCGPVSSFFFVSLYDYSGALFFGCFSMYGALDPGRCFRSSFVGYSCLRVDALAKQIL